MSKEAGKGKLLPIFSLLIEEFERKPRRYVRKRKQNHLEMGKGKAKGIIIKASRKSLLGKIKESSVDRKRRSENPVYLIVQENGSEILKLKSLLDRK